MNYISIIGKRYKLFEYVAMPELSKVNVIIGKNNSGKSSLLDVIGAAYDVEQYIKIKKEIEEITVSIPITDIIIKDLFCGYSSIGKWKPSSFSKEYEGKLIEGEISVKSNSFSPSKLHSQVNFKSEDNGILALKKYWGNGAKSIQSYIDNNTFRRIAAERDIVPECESNVGLNSTGEGASNLIRKIITESAYDESLIEINLLSELNKIMYPEAEYESIRIQQIESTEGTFWEVFLQEKGAKRVALSKTGSGIKTIILLLLNLLVIPEIGEKKKRYVFGFEELENNLHPAMQRKVFEYLYDYAVTNDTVVFLTTHSHVAINCFYDKEYASMFHIIKNRGTAEVKRIESYLDKVEILTDLDVKASDFLQANGIIWVEGPSDRVYVKRWLEIFTDNQFKEGQHY